MRDEMTQALSGHNADYIELRMEELGRQPYLDARS